MPTTASGSRLRAHVARAYNSQGRGGRNDPGYPFPLDAGIRIAGILNFSGPVDQLEAIEEIFRSSADETWQMVGNNMFPPNPRFGREEMIKKFTPFTYFDDEVPPIFPMGRWPGASPGVPALR